MTGHAKHLEEQFDKYSGDGSYRDMCAFLDGEIKELQSGENHTVDKGKLKEQLLRMADMVNNKMYILQSNKCITQQQKDAFVGRFNVVFNQALQEYDIVALTMEDIKQTTKSMNETKNREIQMQSITIESDIEHTVIDEVEINSNDEAINGSDREETQKDNSEQTQRNENRLSLKQKIAKFLQKNNLFMNLSFVEKFVHQELDVLPPTTQETRISSTNQTRTDFENWITNNGQLRNLPPVQRMSEPQKIEEMRRKMEQNQQANEDNERG